MKVKQWARAFAYLSEDAWARAPGSLSVLECDDNKVSVDIDSRLCLQALDGLFYYLISSTFL